MRLRPEDVQAGHILAFYEPCARAQNDTQNKQRETVIEFLLDCGFASRANTFSQHAQHGQKWTRVRKALDRAVLLLARGEGVPDARFEGATRRAGRTSNHDFDFHYRTEGDRILVVKVELKKGESIHDQPQFLSLAAKRGGVTASKFDSYPEFFYANYIDRLAATTTAQRPARAEYLALINQINYERHPFFQSMYDDDNGARSGSVTRETLVSESVAAYLASVASQHNYAVAWDSMRERLAAQVEKRFLSWSTETEDFIIESYDCRDMTLDGTCTSYPDQNPRYLVLGTISGRAIHCMLRWRNHQAVLMPAWQISLVAEPARR